MKADKAALASTGSMPGYRPSLHEQQGDNKEIKWSRSGTAYRWVRQSRWEECGAEIKPERVSEEEKG